MCVCLFCAFVHTNTLFGEEYVYVPSEGTACATRVDDVWNGQCWCAMTVKGMCMCFMCVCE